MKSSICVAILVGSLASALLLISSLAVDGRRSSRMMVGESNKPHWSYNDPRHPGALFKHQKKATIPKATFVKANFGSSRHRDQFSNSIPYSSIPFDSLFDRPNFRSRFQTPHLLNPAPSSFSSSFGQNYRPSSSGVEASSDFSQYAASPAKRQYLLNLAAKLWAHKQAQNEYSNQLLSSFGSNVAPFNKKK